MATKANQPAAAKNAPAKKDKSPTGGKKSPTKPKKSAAGPLPDIEKHSQLKKREEIEEEEKFIGEPRLQIFILLLVPGVDVLAPVSEYVYSYGYGLPGANSMVAI